MATFKNPFSKKNIFWYNKFEYLINQIKENIISKLTNVQEKTELIETSDGKFLIKNPNGNNALYISTGSINLIYKNAKVVMQQNFAQIGVFDGNTFKYGVEINSASGQQNIKVIADDSSFTFDATNIEKLNQLITNNTSDVA